MTDRRGTLGSADDRAVTSTRCGTMWRNMKISSIATILAATVILGYVASIGASLYAVRELKVGGPVYEQVVTIKDLVADILPPPEYVIEAFLESTLVVQDPAGLQKHTERLAQLHKDYTDRRDYWAAQSIDPDVKLLLTRESAQHVDKFWAAVEAELLPALARNDSAGARAAYQKVQAAYEAHRAVIDKLVKQTEVLTTASEAFAKQRASVLQTLSWIAGGVVLAIIVGGAYSLRMGLLRPLTQITQTMDVLAAGRLDVHVPYSDRGDEIGEMAAALNIFRKNGLQIESMRADQEKAALNAQAERRQGLERMATEFESSVLAIVQTVADAAREVEDTATAMSGAVAQFDRQAGNMASSANTASANVQMVSAAAEELSASISEISRQVTIASQVSETAMGEARQANTRVEALSDAAVKIDSVLQLITDIAEQTNLLALNASIEAARAGEAGKGFAVVAAEVKALAKQTSKATDDIGAQLSAVKGGTSQVVSAIDNVSAVIEKVREISMGISGAVSQQGSATAEIARNVQEAARGAQEVSNNISGVTEAAATTGSSAVLMLKAAQDLSKNAAQLKKDAATFLAGVRAA